MLCEYDVPIPLSEWISVTANIYRSKHAAAEGEKVPVVMWAHPYEASEGLISTDERRLHDSSVSKTIA